MEKIISPITKQENVTLVKSLNVKDIVQVYRRGFKIDVNDYFLNLKTVSIYECKETGYRFYYPFGVDGDSAFYEHFQQFDWYYMPWKWEHEISLEYLTPEMKVLEVGCAHGAFLEVISKTYNLSEATGLELNETASIENKGYKIYNETIESFSKKYKNYFDVVCSYQVLEHIADVSSFLKGKIDCLRRGGILIISVPNNDSFVKDVGVGLNSPPHHMGLWNEESLRALEDFFPIKLIKFHLEELQDYHLDSYVFAEHYSKYPYYFGRLIRKFNKLTGDYRNQIAEARSNRKNILGHTILAVYQKM